MELQKQVTSLELSKKLKELGIKQESLFYYWLSFNRHTGEITDSFSIEQKEYTTHPDKCFSAFTVAELGEMLVKTRNDIPTTMFRNTVWMDNEWWATMDTKNNEPVIKAPSEADARAKMLIYLLENNLILWKKK